MPMKKYLVTLDDEEREPLEHLLHRGTHATRQVPRARLLRTAAAGAQDRASAAALSVGRAPVERPRQRLVAEGLGALAERPRPGTPPTLAAQAPARRAPQPGVAHLRAARAGPCPCWPLGAWPSAWRRRRPTSASAAAAKNGPHAVAEATLGLPEVGAECVAALADGLEGSASRRIPPAAGHR